MNKYLKFLILSIVILGGGKTLNSNICCGMEDITSDNIEELYDINFNNVTTLPYTDHNNELINNINKLANEVSKSLANIFPDFQNIAKDVLACVNEAVDQFITSENSSIPTDTIRKEFKLCLSYKDTNNDCIYKTDNITYKQFIHWFEDKSYLLLQKKLQDILDNINNEKYS